MAREDTINIYKKGMDQLQRGLDIPITDCPDEKIKRTKDLQRKMERNLAHVEERLAELSRFFYYVVLGLQHRKNEKIANLCSAN